MLANEGERGNEEKKTFILSLVYFPNFCKREDVVVLLLFVS